MEPTLAHSEREWILLGMAESCAALGFEQTNIADICAAAGVSRSSFEALFADKSECLAAAMEALLEEARRRIEDVASPEKPWAVALRDGVVALLGLLAERPACGRMALVEAQVAGGRAALLRASGRDALLTAIEQGEKHATEPGIPSSAARAALAGVEALVLGAVLADEAERLPELAPEIVYMLSVPYLGHDEVRRIAGGAAGQHRRLRAVA